ncbi:hypothetical protein, conserved [Trypanosoma vivax Y486]|uniref:Uncharacterized protein n=1 Tax=Trypanosoma vivax (strain Y486) TaxID=1055687 RepID=F9WSF3_TRYVY|nr:hypothetical protein, conserved [Trypanosoma vivax Y486]|eukprot:CCD20492.1 hypothetical protein, conserved [Trypanosoma vivax Y486]
MVALLPPQRAPVRLDADAVMACVKSTQVDHTISCTGRAKGRQHAPAPVATEQSRVFSEAVAVEIGMWGDDPVGVDQIPMELVLPHENGSATFGIAGVVAATSRTHVAAFVPGASQHGAWDMYDGMVHRVVPNGPEPKTVVLLIYRRRRDEDADMDGCGVQRGFDDANEECAPEGAGARRTSSTHRSGRATRSHRQCRRKCPETSVAEERLAASEREPVAHRMQRGATWTRRTGRRRWLSFFALWANTWRKHTAVMRPRACLMTRRRVPRMRKRHRSRRRVRRWTHRHPTVTRPRACLMTRRRVPRMRKRHRSRWRWRRWRRWTPRSARGRELAS